MTYAVSVWNDGTCNLPQTRLPSARPSAIASSSQCSSKSIPFDDCETPFGASCVALLVGLAFLGDSLCRGGGGGGGGAAPAAAAGGGGGGAAPAAAKKEEVVEEEEEAMDFDLFG
mmetsp:Transcript_45535/g.99000  ORF Transcript_45535/g.99000 Transcript_45535/m.99000 type:complete len:115 (-) Transcript_45535:53-397(-)